MLGTWINVGTVLAGTVVGGLLGERLKPQTHSTVTSVLGCITCVLGIESAMKTPDALKTAAVAPQLGFFLVVMLSLLFGALLGETLDIEGWLHRLGQFAEKRFGQSDGDFGKGFVTASLLFCVGPLTILGCFQDGLKGDYSLLATKAVLDGFAAMAFSAAFGWGVALSAVTVLVIQGGLTLSAGAVQPLMNEVMITAMTAAGGIILMGLGLKLLDIKQMRVANLLPALVFAPVFVALCNFVKPGFFPVK